ERFTSIIKVLQEKNSKNLIYAGTYGNIETISRFLLEKSEVTGEGVLVDFSSWLKEAYGDEYALAELAIRKTGVHNGRLHRSIGQLQIKLFDDPEGLKNIVSTSSIIEGVNTSARNVIIWSKKN